MPNATQTISIVMPVKNAGAFLAPCLDSILAQTATDWQLLATDDHSDDGSRQVLENYAQRDRRILVFTNRGKGIIDGLRTACAHATGTFITRMDADDLMPPQKLATLRQNLLNSGSGYLSLGHVCYFADPGLLGDGYTRYAEWLNRRIDSADFFAEIYRECVVPSPCWMLWRDDFERIGGFRPDRYPEDYDLCFRMYRGDLKKVHASEILHHWRDYGWRSSRTDPNYADNRFSALKVDYFLELDRDLSRPLVLLGAGRRGKRIARLLTENETDFRWLSNNLRKVGHDIYGTVVEAEALLDNLPEAQILVLVSSPGEQRVLETRFAEEGRVSGRDYFWFC